MEHPPFVLCDNLVKIYKIADLEVVALQGLNLEVAEGEIVALIGPSGSGKSTLLNIIGGLDAPSAGSVWVGDVNLLKLDSRSLEQYKRTSVGFLWQQPGRNLLPHLTARENVELPMLLNRIGVTQRRRRALELIETVGLLDRANFYPDRLSGGQQQRIALAVALANTPPLLLTDEPTGQVDSQASARILESMRLFSTRYGTTIIIVTHDASVTDQVDRVVAISDGRTSVEIQRRVTGDSPTPDEEWTILDKSRHLQLPKQFVETLGMARRVKVRLEPDHLSIWPHQLVQIPPQVQLDETPILTGQKERFRSLVTKPPSTVITEDLCRDYTLAAEVVHALSHINLQVPAGSLTVVSGRSGSGKTTLLNLIAGLDEPTSGTVRINDKDLSILSENQKIALRREQIGFVHQTLGMLPFLTLEENVQIPLRLQGLSRQERQLRSSETLALVGLAARTRHRAYELSGGEQQRAAIARALISHPSLILADEPTGQLDSLTGARIIALFRTIVDEIGITVIIASHDPKVAESADHVIHLLDGRLVGAIMPENQ